MKFPTILFFGAMASSSSASVVSMNKNKYDEKRASTIAARRAGGGGGGGDSVFAHNKPADDTDQRKLHKRALGNHPNAVKVAANNIEVQKDDSNPVKAAIASKIEVQDDDIDCGEFGEYFLDVSFTPDAYPTENYFLLTDPYDENSMYEEFAQSGCEYGCTFTKCVEYDTWYDITLYDMMGNGFSSGGSFNAKISYYQDDTYTFDDILIEIDYEDINVCSAENFGSDIGTGFCVGDYCDAE